MLNNYKRKCSTPIFYTTFIKKTLVKSVNIILHSQKRLILSCHQTLKIPFKEHNGKQKRQYNRHPNFSQSSGQKPQHG